MLAPSLDRLVGGMINLLDLSVSSHGEIVSQSFNDLSGGGQDAAWPPRAKSLLSALIGIAVERGQITCRRRSARWALTTMSLR
jgi:hypothetical protein